MTRKRVVLLVSLSLQREDGLREVSSSVHTLRTYLSNNLDEGYISIATSDYLTNENARDIAKNILSFEPDLIGISCYIWNLNKIVDVCRYVRPNTNAKIVLGGPGIQEIGYSLIESGLADYSIVGPGESSLLDLTRIVFKVNESPNLSSVPRLTWKDDSSYIHTNEYEKNLETPIYSSFWSSDNLALSVGSKLAVTLEWARGCPFSCAYCSWGAVSAFHVFPLKGVLEDLKLILCNEAVESLLVCHSDAFINESDALVFLKTIRAYNRKNMPIYINVRLENLTQTLLNSAANTPGVQLGVGIQSTSSYVLKACNRMPFSKKKYDSVRGGAIHNSYPVSYDLIIGLPKQTESTFINSVNDVFRLRPMAMNIYRLQILPDSGLWHRKIEEGLFVEHQPPYRVLHTNWLSKDVINKLMMMSFWVEVVTWDVFLRDCVVLIDSETSNDMSCVEIISSICEHMKDKYIELTSDCTISLICTTDSEHSIKSSLYEYTNTCGARKVMIDKMVDIAIKNLPSNMLECIHSVATDYKRILNLLQCVPDYHLLPDGHHETQTMVLHRKECLVFSRWSTSNNYFSFNEVEKPVLVFDFADRAYAIEVGVVANSNEECVINVPMCLAAKIAGANIARPIA